MSDERLIDDTGGSRLHRGVSPKRMALDQFNSKINDPWLSRDDAILHGAMGLEGLDQLISFVQRVTLQIKWRYFLHIIWRKHMS
jgi:hypothetical protein